MLKPVSRKSLIRYEPPGQDEGESPTVLVLRPWPNHVYAAILDALRELQRDARVAYDAVRAALVDIENMVDEEGNKVVLGSREERPTCFGEMCELVPKESLDDVPFKAIEGAFMRLVQEGKLSEADRKNS